MENNSTLSKKIDISKIAPREACLESIFNYSKSLEIFYTSIGAVQVVNN